MQYGAWEVYSDAMRRDSNEMKQQPEWSIFRKWGLLLPQATSFQLADWSIFESLLVPFEVYSKKKEKEILGCLQEWDTKLREIGGEPRYRDWNDFRPLRLGKEEDWSDWFFYLILSSRSGYFSKLIFNLEGFSQEDYCNAVDKWREASSEGYRCDILINWANRSFTHLEVKTGDPNLEKTAATALAMRKRFQRHNERWFDAILLMGYQLPAWEDIRSKLPVNISTITWEDVALALRKSLLYGKEDISWRVWARTFLGAVEQKLLEFPYIKKDRTRINEKIMEPMITILTGGLKNG